MAAPPPDDPGASKEMIVQDPESDACDGSGMAEGSTVRTRLVLGNSTGDQRFPVVGVATRLLGVVLARMGKRLGIWIALSDGLIHCDY